FVVLDASDGKDAAALRVNQSSKLANARDTGAVMRASCAHGAARCGIDDVVLPATVDFSPEHVVEAGPTGFPPNKAQPGSVGESGYSPLIQLPNGSIVNAPHVANVTGLHDKVVEIDYAQRKVRLRETDGFQGGKAVKYISTESSFDVAAALEESTYVPRLNAAPFAGGDGTDSSRASLAAFVNGQTGAANPNRQGLNSALLDHLSPLNVLFWNPSQGRYSPLWDVHAAAWSAQAIAQGLNTRQTDFGKVRNLAQKGLVTAPDGTPFAASGFIVNCPIVSSD
ncbi:MAG TPA: hypothetical protein VLC55_06435, partial [Burkholderiales bacterium]|nr:hypothetical protein [Burkholderiales bacterium]